ncbi:alpha/beta hydrolase, partial [Klebsiella pneumoniae]|uniref:alpha/beta hydrolase n=1 Tax=Klebsiella pneumoniae TaxID=573 RepID=UPI0021662DD2
CVCGKKIGPDPRNFNQRVSLGRNDLLIRTFLKEISPRPILFIHGEKAHSLYFSKTAYEAANQPKELLIVKNATHVDLYDRMDKIPFDNITAFFNKNLNK